MSQPGKNVFEDILKELERSYVDGDMDEATYHSLRAQYLKKQEEYVPSQHVQSSGEGRKTKFKVMGSQSVTDRQINVAGSARIPGGIVPKLVKVSGSCKIWDDIELNGIHCSGWLRSAGSILSHGNIRVSGALKTGGNLSAEGEVQVSGSMKVNGELNTTDNISVSGSLKTEGRVIGTTGIKVSGRLKAHSNIKSDSKIEVKGILKVEGSVYGGDVKIKDPTHFRRFLRKLIRSRVTRDVVSQGLVDINNIHVEGNVYGTRVKIGPNSRIDGKIYYVDDLSIDPDVSYENEPEKTTQNDPRRVEAREMPSKLESQPVKPSFCPKCGQETGEDKKFCPACGSQL